MTEKSQKSKGGRPKKSEVRKHIITVRFDDLELANLERTAKTYEVSVSEIIRASVLNIRLPAPVPQINREQWSALGNISANLNQSIKSFNEMIKTGQIKAEKYSKVLNELGKTVRFIQALKTELLTGVNPNDL